MSEPKKTVSMRLSDVTVNELSTLTKRFKVSQANLISILVHMAYTEEGLESNKLDEWIEIARLS